jgi:hypothetical protein
VDENGLSGRYCLFLGKAGTVHAVHPCPRSPLTQAPDHESDLEGRNELEIDPAQRLELTSVGEPVLAKDVKSVGVALADSPTLFTIIGTFKSKTITDTLANIEENRLDMIGKIRQRNYFEKIIRNERDLEDTAALHRIY